MLTTHCPKCEILKKKMDAKGLDYEEIDDVEKIKEYGVDAVPVLILTEVEGRTGTTKLNYREAVQFINEI